MQEGYFDYSSEGRNTGCCLDCDDSHDGCLCHDCGCTKCYWYNQEGFCDKVAVLKEEGRLKAIEWHKRQGELEYKKGQVLREDNEKKLKELMKKGKIHFEYTCQRCFRSFISEGELKIIKYKEPICDLCLNKLEVEV